MASNLPTPLLLCYTFNTPQWMHVSTTLHSALPRRVVKQLTGFFNSPDCVVLITGPEPSSHSPSPFNPSAPPALFARNPSQPTSEVSRTSNLYHPSGPMAAHLAKTPHINSAQYDGRGPPSRGDQVAAGFPNHRRLLVVLVREAKLLNSLKCLMGVVPTIEERICK